MSSRQVFGPVSARSFSGISAATESGWAGSLRRLPFPEQLRARLWVVADLVQRRGVVEAAVEHHHADRLRVADVLERIPVQDDQVRELARLDRSDLLVQPQRARAVD